MQAFPAKTRASHSVAHGVGLSVATAGVYTEFSLLAKDTYGNDETKSSEGNFSVAFRNAATGGVSAPAAIDDSLRGLYTVGYVPREAGIYSVDVKYNRMPIFGSPYTLLVRPGRADVTKFAPRVR